MTVAAGDLLAVGELMARYTRAVDGLDFDRLDEVLEDDATVRYAWLPVGAEEHSRVELAGREAVVAWLRARLTGRPDLRRFLANLELVGRTPPAVVARVAMHERDMRITGTYEVAAVPGPRGWRIRRLDLVETIHGS